MAPVATGSEQRTIMAQPAPNLQALQGQGAGAGQKTQAMMAPNLSQGQGGAAGRTQAFSPDGNATAFMPDGMGGLSPMALVARQQALTQGKKAPPKLPPLFWVGWALIGASVGLAMHFLWPAAS